MKSEDCGLKDECETFLVEFPDRVPHRCSLCTPIVRYVLQCLRDKDKDSFIWNEGVFDE